MAIRTYIDGGKQAITFNNDTQPVAVYVDGDLQENVSFVPDTVQGTGSVEYLSEYKKNHIQYEVQGTTIQDGTPTPEAPIPIQNANDNGMSVVLHGKNLATAEQVCEKFYKYKKQEFDGRECVSFTQEQRKYFTLEGGFKPNTQYTISFDVNTTGSGTGHIMFVLYEDIALNYARDSVGTTGDGEWKHIVKTTLAGHTVKGIGQQHLNSSRTIYIDINSFMLQEGAVTAPVYEPYFRETVEIPTSIDVNGTSVPLLFSEYDKLTVDRVNNEVIYYNGGYSKTLNGNEAMGSSTTLSKVWVTITFKLTGDGFCNQFLSPTDFIFANNLSFGDSGMAFPMSRFSSTNALATFLTEQYNNGTPVVILAQKETPTPYNITTKDLGKSLLNLATQNQTNYFEITSNANAPQTPINFTFAKWGGRNENNNNT